MGIDRNLALEGARVTEAAAVAAARLIGRGNEKDADQAAVDAMRTALNALDMAGTVVIGEGERDEAPMLYIGERVGTGKGQKIDIALDPLEGTTITAKGAPNALAVVTVAPLWLSRWPNFWPAAGYARWSSMPTRATRSWRKDAESRCTPAGTIC